MTAPFTSPASCDPNCPASLGAAWGRIADWCADVPAKAAPVFTLTQEDVAEYEAKAARGFGDLWLKDKINAFDFDHRQVVGVYGSLSPVGKTLWQDEWHRDLAHHMERARAALELARRPAVSTLSHCITCGEWTSEPCIYGGCPFRTEQADNRADQAIEEQGGFDGAR